MLTRTKCQFSLLDHQYDDLTEGVASPRFECDDQHRLCPSDSLRRVGFGTIFLAILADGILFDAIDLAGTIIAIPCLASGYPCLLSGTPHAPAHPDLLFPRVFWRQPCSNPFLTPKRSMRHTWHCIRTRCVWHPFGRAVLYVDWGTPSFGHTGWAIHPHLRALVANARSRESTPSRPPLRHTCFHHRHWHPSMHLPCGRTFPSMQGVCREHTLLAPPLRSTWHRRLSITCPPGPGMRLLQPISKETI